MEIRLNGTLLYSLFDSKVSGLIVTIPLFFYLFKELLCHRSYRGVGVVQEGENRGDRPGVPNLVCIPTISKPGKRVDGMDAYFLVTIPCSGEEDRDSAVGDECLCSSIRGEEEDNKAVEKPAPGNPVISEDGTFQAADDLFLLLFPGHLPLICLSAPIMFALCTHT